MGPTRDEQVRLAAACWAKLRLVTCEPRFPKKNTCGPRRTKPRGPLSIKNSRSVGGRRANRPLPFCHPLETEISVQLRRSCSGRRAPQTALRPPSLCCPLLVLPREQLSSAQESAAQRWSGSSHSRSRRHYYHSHLASLIMRVHRELARLWWCSGNSYANTTAQDATGTG